MKAVDLYALVRRARHVEGMSQRQAARVFGIDPKTVAKMLRFSVPPGYRRSKPPVRPKVDTRRRPPSNASPAPRIPGRPLVLELSRGCGVPTGSPGAKA